MRILVIRFSSAGDIVLTSLFVRALRQRFPEAEIHYLVKEQYRPLVENSPHIDRVHAIRDDAGLFEIIRFKSILIGENGGDYDIVFDLHDSIRSRYFRLGLGKELSIVRKPTRRKRLLVRKKINTLRPIVPIAELYLETGRKWGVENDGAGLELFLGRVQAPILPIPGRISVALAPGARHFTKRWPAERFAALGATLAGQFSARIVLLGGPDERELCSSIAARIGGDVINLSGRAGLLEAAAALDACDLVVTNDSAIAHIAAARHRPVVDIFGSTVQEFGFAPYGTTGRVVENEGLYCRPCTTIGRDACPEGHFRCMEEISVERVISAITDLLSDAR